MNKMSIKNYAIWARNELISRVAQKAYEYGVEKENIIPSTAESINGKLLSSDEKKKRQRLITEVNHKGYDQVIEEVAYTWFNRFIALRFMEVNNYLPNKVRLFTNENNEFKPQIIDEALHVGIPGLDRSKVLELKEANNNEELYKELLLAICNDMHNYLPGMFETIDDYMTLLFPNNLLREESVLGRLISDIDEDSWTDQVQIIGWLYQYYNTEPKDRTFADLKKNIKITKEKVPSATQLFTPDWIVRYMTENSLGRLWLDGHNDKGLKVNWKYYLDEAKQEESVQAELNKIKVKHAKLRPEDIKFIDPCMGSGHILVYAFDVLMQIYISEGWTEREATKSILQNNLYGLDIDERAYQLSNFALMMKARQYNRRILSEGIVPNVMAIQESNTFNRTLLDRFEDLKPIATRVLDTFIDAKEYGSILNVEFAKEQLDNLENKLNEINKLADLGDLVVRSESLSLIGEFSPFLKQARIMSQKYECVVTNPPYMGLRNMSKKLFDYVMAKHKDTKQDIFGVFMKICIDNLCANNGKTAMITQHVWMFTSGFEIYRKALYANRTISSMVHLGTRAFEEISGEVVQTCAFVIDKVSEINYQGTYIRLVNYNTAAEKETQFFNRQNYYFNESENYLSIPGSPVCYWLSDRIIDVFRNNPLVGDVSSTRQGLKTSDDKRFIRLFFEVADTKIAKGTRSLEEAAASGKKWFWLNKGGQVKWYGNNVFLINWENDGKEVKDYATQVAGSYSKNITAIDAYFKHCISWPQISLSHPSFRYVPDGYIFASAGPSLFVKDEEQKWYMLGLLNSTVTQSILDAINPTINFGVSDILKVPYIFDEKYKDEVDVLVKRAIDLANESWDCYEILWDFKKHPLIIRRGYIEALYIEWAASCDKRFNELKMIETKLNNLFCQIYGLTQELDVSVDENAINVSRADLRMDIKGLISYAVGCMFGRYSLDKDGVVFAGGDWSITNYKAFKPDQDAIIPICDDEYFEDDIVGRFVEFIRAAYGEDYLEDNLKFIADAIGSKGSSREVIRNYFINDFYNDHLMIYQKRPIYWQFDSGKKNGFKALIYIHRYTPDLIARMRTSYVHEQQSRYANQIAMTERQIDSAASTSERVKLEKKLKDLKDQAEEIRVYEEKIHHWADKMEPMDLDDGVKVNYAKFQELLTKIK